MGHSPLLFLRPVIPLAFYTAISIADEIASNAFLQLDIIIILFCGAAGSTTTHIIISLYCIIRGMMDKKLLSQHHQ